MLDRNLALEVVRVTEAAALEAARFMGRHKREKADEVAAAAMRDALDTIDIRGTIKIRGRDEVALVRITDRVGAGWAGNAADSPEVDIAVNPLEGRNLCATGGPDAISVIAIADDGEFFSPPWTHMDKIAVGREARGVIDLRQSATWNLQRIAKAKNKQVEDCTAVILDRDRHEGLIGEVRQAGARIRLISDGDVSGAVMTARPDSGIDVLFGVGGAPEAVIAAAALRCMGGEIQARMGTDGPERGDQIYSTEDLAGGDVMFAATGVTKGHLLDGVKFLGDVATTESIVMRSKSGTVRVIQATHYLTTKPRYPSGTRPSS
jgi:fructose-1,6-bisphosphatase II